ncbi:MAG: hypothetical protein ACJA08_000005 [Cyclobacteriaceae bacterium]|jgi:hypothetical protein
MKTAGYSGTPLVKKLGIKAHYHCLILHEPNHYVELLEDLPENVIFKNQINQPFDFFHAFFTKQDDYWPNVML